MATILRDKTYVRFAVLILVGLVQATNYYFYDALSPLKSVLESELGFRSTDYGLFVAAYSIPNLFLAMAFFGGIILDKIGIRRTGFIFVFLMAVGSFITAYGASDYYRDGGMFHGFMSSFLESYTPELKMMLFGRFVYGLGAETSIVVISKIIVKWFKGKELALAFGLKIGLARGGSALAFIISPRLIDSAFGWNTPIWFAASLVGLGLILFMIYMLQDVRLDKQMGITSLKQKKEDQFKWPDLVALLTNRSFLYVTALCVTFYSAVFPFLSFSSDFFLNKFGFSLEQSGDISSFLPIGTTIFTPLFGLFVDKRGKSATLMIFGSLLLLIVHLTFALTYATPYLMMIILGIAFSLIPAAMWPAVAKIVDEKKIGTAYGLMFTIQNIGLAIFPILAGVLLDKTNPPGSETLDYTATILMFAILGLVGLMFAILLKRQDKISGYGLELPSNKKA